MIEELNNVPDAATTTSPKPKLAYHKPEMIEHGELALLTKGAGDTGFDGGGYSTFS